MKEVKFLYRVQAVLHPFNTLILATILEYGLKIVSLPVMIATIFQCSFKMMYLRKV